MLKFVINLGIFCFLSVVDCSASGGNPCMNGGTCENNACTCAAEFNGALCSAGNSVYCNIRSYCNFYLLIYFEIIIILSIC